MMSGTGVQKATWPHVLAMSGFAPVDAEFIELTRSVYLNNDKRAGIKRRINELSGSGLIEEKQYTAY